MIENQIIENQSLQNTTKISKKDIAKSIAVKLLGLIGLLILAVIAVVITDVVDSFAIQLVVSMVAFAAILFITQGLIRYKKNNILLNSIFAPIIMGSGSLFIFLFAITHHDTPLNLISSVALMLYCAYFICHIDKKMQINDAGRLISVSICSFYVLMLTIMILEQTVGFVAVTSFTFLVLNSKLFKDQKTFVKLISCAMLFPTMALGGIAARNFVVAIGAIILGVYAIAKRRKTFWLCAMSCLALIWGEGLIFLITGLIIFVVGIVRFCGKWLVCKGNLFHSLYIVLSVIVVLGSLFVFDELRNYEIWLGCIWIAFTIINTVYLYKTMIKSERLVKPNFNIISLAFIQLLALLFSIGYISDSNYLDDPATIGAIIFTLALFPSTLYCIEKKTASVLMLVLQHLKLAILLVVISYVIIDELTYLFALPCASFFAMIFTSLRLGMRRTCRASVIISAILGLTTLFFFTQISTIWHLISFGVFASIMVFGFVSMWKYVNKEFALICDQKDQDLATLGQYNTDQISEWSTTRHLAD